MVKKDNYKSYLKMFHHRQMSTNRENCLSLQLFHKALQKVDHIGGKGPFLKWFYHQMGLNHNNSKLSSLLKKYCSYKEGEILALNQTEFNSLISNARFNGEHIEDITKSTQKVKKLLHDRSVPGFYQCV